jgi:hypothetical protein
MAALMPPHGGDRQHPPSSASESGDIGIRPYLLTKGRTRPVDTTVQIETLLLTTDLGRRRLGHLSFEHAAIVRQCSEVRSVAEVSAELHIPLGVAMVLVGDLTSDGLLETHSAPTSATDLVHLITRLIHGVRQL